MDKKQAYELIEKQIKEIVSEVEKELLERSKHVLSSGGVSEEDLEKFLGERGDSYALTKAIINSWFNDKTYEPPKHLTEYVEMFKKVDYA
ncbi:MAG: hypothetical protein KO464_02330 [Candidatus Methanofastidiosum sp.]|nr:hypothetical protein [Methanofastidiosum sp.]